MRQEPDIWASKSRLLRHTWNDWGWDQFHADSCERISGCSLDLLLTGGRVVFSLSKGWAMSTEPIDKHKPESKPVTKNCMCPSAHDLLPYNLWSLLTVSGTTEPMWPSTSQTQHVKGKIYFWLMVSDSPVHPGKKSVMEFIVSGAYSRDTVVDEEVKNTGL